MKLIIILITLGMERYLGVGAILKRFSWFNNYLGLLRSISRSDSLWKGPLGVAWVVAPLLIIVALIYFLLSSYFYDVMGLAIGLVILLYCLGPEDLHQELRFYLVAMEKEDKETAKTQAQIFLDGEVPENESQMCRAITKKIFVEANERLFGVLFWFVVLGPVGAVLYRTSALLRHTTQTPDSKYASLSGAAQVWQNLLDWIPVRIVTLAYALAGNFPACLGAWLKHMLVGLRRNEEMLETCGLVAAGLNDENASGATVQENRNALGTINWSLIFALVLIALFTIGAWIY